MTVKEVKKAIDMLSIVERKEIHTYINAQIPLEDSNLPESLKKELERIDQGMANGSIGLTPNSAVRDQVSEKYGI